MFKRKLLSKYLSRRIRRLIAENKKNSRFDKEMAYEEIKKSYNRLIQSEKGRIYLDIREFFKTIDSQK